MKHLKKSIVCFLAGIMTLGCVGCVSNETQNDSSFSDIPTEGMPVYTDSTLQFDFYGYQGPTNGSYNEYGESFYSGQDFRTVERFKEYKDAGMTQYLLTEPAFSAGSSWETSETKQIYDKIYEAGIKEIYIQDTRLSFKSKIEGGIVGEGKEFATEADLDAYVADCLSDYQHVDGLGVHIGDEPVYDVLECYGQMYRSIKRVAPDMEIHANVLPMITNLSSGFWGTLSEEETEGLTNDEIREETYKRYINKYLDETQAEYLQYDQYPMAESTIYPTYMRCLQINAEICRDRGIDLKVVTQTCAYNQNGGEFLRVISEEDARWLNNMLVGYGVKGISYFNYWRKTENNQHEFFKDGASFITSNGQKTPIYTFMQQIMKEEQQFAPTVLNFEYSDSAIYKVAPLKFVAAHVGRYVNGSFKKITDVSVNKEIVLVTELFDKDQDQYMYMIQNIIDPINKGSKAYQTTTVTFAAEYDYAVVWERGESRLVKLDNHTFTVKQHPGDAVYVMPY